jgi:hypothetical protein
MRTIKSHLHALLACAAMLVSASGVAMADPSPDDIEAARTSVDEMTPYDAGSRYGQALGAVEICPGAQTTTKVPVLNTLYTDDNLQTFNAQAKKIYEAWIKLKQCTLLDDPSECKVIVDESCAAALSEIGSSGTVLPGLLVGARR